MSADSKPTFTVAEIAAKVQGEVTGDGAIELHGFAPADIARPGDLTFAENEDFFARAEQSEASAILVSGDFTSEEKTLIRVKNARLAFAHVLPLLFPEKKFSAGVHTSAVVADSAEIHPTAHVGPHCVIHENAKLAPGVVVQSGSNIAHDCSLGEGTHLFPNVTLYPRTQIGKRVRIHAGTIIGSDGFGYVFDSGVHHKIPQVGNVVIHDDVEIGAGVAIDRGALGSTEIGKGTKIDNLVQIAHNLKVGENCIIVAQAGFAGSTQIGNFTTIAGQAGVAGHLKIGAQVTVMAKAGVMNSIPDGEVWLGVPARPHRQMKRQFIAVEQLPDLIKRIRHLEKKVQELGGSTD
ncbi:MAG: UDP-3-O-[3-hydroxymyristoyl] glucosamine N-acyltransferase [Limisphaerales bacterium]|jgi:UDP-3-O-[3-hydroxymyristoyl] glucosamine N-acyltransferase